MIPLFSIYFVLETQVLKEQPLPPVISFPFSYLPFLSLKIFCSSLQFLYLFQIRISTLFLLLNRLCYDLFDLLSCRIHLTQ